MITIPGELISLKNSKRILFKHGMKSKTLGGRPVSYKSKIPFIAASEAAKKQEIRLIRLMKTPELKEQWDKEIEGKEFPLVLYYRIFRRTDGVFDYINIVQGLFDAMTKSKWIPDDDKLHLRSIPQGWEKDAENPRIEIHVMNKGDKITI